MSTSVLRVPSVRPPGRSYLSGFCLAQNTECKGASQGAAPEGPASTAWPSGCGAAQLRRPSSRGGRQPCPEAQGAQSPLGGLTHRQRQAPQPTLSSPASWSCSSLCLPRVGRMAHTEFSAQSTHTADGAPAPVGSCLPFTGKWGAGQADAHQVPSPGAVTRGHAHTCQLERPCADSFC